MANISLLASLFFLLLIPIAYSESVSVSLDVTGIEIAISQPSNTTYIMTAGDNTTFTFSSISSSDSTFNITAYLDNIVIYSNTSYPNSSQITFGYFADYGSHNFTVYAKDSTNTKVSSIIFENIRPASMFFAPIIPLIMGAGALLFLVRAVIENPRNPKEFAEYIVGSVVIFSILAGGIIIIMGLI